MTQRTDDFIAAAKVVGSYSFDVEHDPSVSVTDSGFKLAGMSFATKDIVFYERDMVECEKITDALFPTDLEAIAYNGKYDLKCMTRVKLCHPYTYPKQLRDPMVMVNLLDENRQPNELGLKVVVWDQYAHKMVDFLTAWALGPLSSQFAAYACEDAQWEFKLFHDLKPQLLKEDLWRVFTKIIMPACLVYSDIELVGVRWDINHARVLLQGFQKLRKQMREDVVAEIGEINLDSGDQIAKRLFEEMGYSTRGIEMTKSGARYSTDAKNMEKLAKKYPIAEKIVRYRTASKMIGTYVEPLTRMALADDFNRIHPTFWIVSTTGRTRCEKPNFQNIPAWLDKFFKHLSIRDGIVTNPGWKLIVADLSQIELRVCAHLTGDPGFTSAYVDWQCTACGTKGKEATKILHACPNCGHFEEAKILKDPSVNGFWHGMDLHQMTTDGVSALAGDRQAGKMCNFALIYCATAPRLHYEHPAFPMRKWEEIIEEYFIKYAGVRRWHKQMEHAMLNGGTCRDMFGRKRRIRKRDIHKNMKHALNMFVNFPVQASACNYIQLVMARLRQKWIDRGEWLRTILQSNFVHDEGVWECPEEHVEKYSAEIKHEMEFALQMNVPVRADILVVDRWGHAKGG